MSLDREIEQLLAVDPSPGFVARVRQRVTAEPAPATWWFSWRLASAGAALAAIALAAILWPAGIAPTADQAIAPSAKGTIAPATNGAIAPTANGGIAPTMNGAVAPTAKGTIAPTTNAAIALPELVLSAEEQRAFALLIMTVEDDVLPDVPSQEAAVGPAWIQIDPVAIAPIAGSGAE